MTSTLTDHTETLEPILDAPEDVDPAPEPLTDQSELAKRPRVRRSRRRMRWIAITAVAAMLLAGGIATAVAHKSVELDVDGQTSTAGTFAATVGEFLESQGVTLTEHDMVVPGLEEPLTEGADIVVRTAEQVNVNVDGEPVQLWTVGDTAAQALLDFAISDRDAAMVASRTGGRPSLGLPLVADGPVTFVVDGQTSTLQFSGVSDLSSALLAAEIEVAPADRVTVTHSSAGPVVTVTRVTTEIGTRTEAIAFETVERDTDELYQGQSRVISEGSDGVRTYTFVNRMVDGEVTSSRLQSVAITTEPVDRIVENGTAQRPAPATSGGGGGSVSGDVWAALAQCESGGNPRAVSSNGLYHGLYQFSVSTWRSVGGSGLPSQASPAEQTQRAQALQARSGWGQWPHCSSVLGLR
ncbi:MAG: ubiquitin-like domain-containing protein [Beutenbergiaceae bacterium]